MFPHSSATVPVTTISSTGLPSPEGIAISFNDQFAVLTSWCYVLYFDIATGLFRTLAGSFSCGFANGAGQLARFNNPRDIAISPDDTFALIVDSGNNCVRRVGIADGVVTTLAGSQLAGFVDGTGVSASFRDPRGIAISPSGIFALVADTDNESVRRIEIASGVVTTLAVSPMSGSNNGPRPFVQLSSVAISPDGTYALVTTLNAVRRIAISSGNMTILAGGISQGYQDGVGTSAAMSYPTDIAISPDGTYALVADGSNNRVRRVAIANGNVTTLAGSGNGQNVDGIGTSSTFSSLSAVSISSGGAFALCAGSAMRLLTLAAPCSAGYYCTNTGMSSSTGQIACTSSKYCPAGSTTGNTTCVGGSVCSTPATQIQCDAGFYCPIGSTEQAPCASGTFCPAGSTNGSTICAAGSFCATSASQISCFAGTFCPANSTAPFACNVAGYFCPTGSTSARQVPCDAGFYCSSLGLGSSASQAACSEPGYYCPAGSSSIRQFPCSAGFYCDTTGIASNASQLPCAAGFYCPPGSSSPTPSQTPCSAGCYCPSASTSAFQIVCPKGSFCPQQAAFPTSCPRGSFCPDEKQSSATACSSGYFCNATGMTAASVCPDGYYCQGAGLTAPTGMCSAGFYCSPNTPWSTRTGAGVCSGGYFCPAGSTGAEGNGTLCSAGLYCGPGSFPKTCSIGFACPQGSAAQTPCQSGSICPKSGMSAPLDCPDGFFCQGNMLTAVTGACRAGHYCAAGSALPTGTGACPGGTYCPQGSSSFSGVGDCAPGYYCRSGSDRQSCRPGFYCPAASAEPQPCSTGAFCPDAGMSAMRDCDAGAYCRTAGLSAPTGQCPGGYFCRTGTASPTTNECQSGYICPPGSSAPTLCPTGYYCATAALIVATGQCAANQKCPLGSAKPSDGCPAGSYCIDSQTTIVCPIGSFCPAYVMAPIPCPAGSVCPQTSLGEPFPCPGGFYCNATGLSAATARCGVGQLCPPGSAAAQSCPTGFVCGAAGMSIAVGCPVGQACSATGLVATCPAGTFAFANSSECTACPDGLYNARAGWRLKFEH